MIKCENMYTKKKKNTHTVHIYVLLKMSFVRTISNSKQLFIQGADIQFYKSLTTSTIEDGVRNKGDVEYRMNIFCYQTTQPPCFTGTCCGVYFWSSRQFKIADSLPRNKIIRSYNTCCYFIKNVVLRKKPHIVRGTIQSGKEKH